MALLPAEAFNFRYSHSLDSELRQRLFHFLELEWLDDRFQFFHVDVVNWQPPIALQSQAERGTRSLNNAARRLQSRICAKTRVAKADFFLN
jgi:hypothetical protein